MFIEKLRLWFCFYLQHLIYREGRVRFVLKQIKRCWKHLRVEQNPRKTKSFARQITNMDSQILKKRIDIFLKIIFGYDIDNGNMYIIFGYDIDNGNMYFALLIKTGRIRDS